MEKAILKTLIYSDIFDYPLKAREIHRWLIGRRSTFRQVQKGLNEPSKLSSFKEYYFLLKRGKVVRRRQSKEKHSTFYLRKAKIIALFLKLIPWVRLVGVSGNLAVNNAGRKDDIDLFIITGKGRLWLCRILILGLLDLMGQRRKRIDNRRKIAGKFCVNILLEEDKLEQQNKDLFTAHEVLQMKVLWQKNGIYTQYLEDNSWAFKFLPNWVDIMEGKRGSLHSAKYGAQNIILDYLEKLARNFQLKIMQKPKGMERIGEGSLYFHPNDVREEVLKKYGQKVRKIISP